MPATATATAAARGTTLVIGAGGKTGRRVAARLSAAGHRVRPASRGAATRFDWNDPATWGPALDGAAAAYITYHPDLALPGAADTVGAFAEQAVAAGTRRLVLLSGRGEAGARQAEQRVEHSGADWTIVRCAFFNQNFSESFFAGAVRRGRLAMPGGDTAEPFVDADDIADVVHAALTDDGHIGRLYELTGPRLLTLAEAAAELGAALGREVRYQPLSAEAFARELAGLGLPAADAGPIAALIAEVLDGRNAHLSDGVQQALGRPPRDFGDYARRAAASGVWDLAQTA
jgi:uncharacterized protein YbjT (DUF2867 family)